MFHYFFIYYNVFYQWNLQNPILNIHIKCLMCHYCVSNINKNKILYLRKYLCLFIYKKHYIIVYYEFVPLNLNSCEMRSHLKSRAELSMSASVRAYTLEI